MKESKEIIRKRTDIVEHFTREISLEYRIYFLPVGESVQKTNPYLTYYPRVARQDSEI
jgi:hypothetical protein